MYKGLILSGKLCQVYYLRHVWIKNKNKNRMSDITERRSIQFD
jgi:hypothetical protein